MKYLTTILLLFCLQRGVCQKTDKVAPINVEKISEIYYSRGGGEYGFNETFRITKDSIIYSIGTYSLPRKIKRQKNKSINWNKLTRSINLKEFDNVPEGKDERALDGIDTRITIETSIASHSMIVNYDTLNQFPSVEAL